MLFLSELSVLERIRVKGELAGLAVVVEIVWMLVVCYILLLSKPYLISQPAATHCPSDPTHYYI